MDGENAQGNGVRYWLIYVEFFGPGTEDALEHAQRKVVSMFGVNAPVEVPKRMYLRFDAQGGTEMQPPNLASRFDSKEAAEGRLFYLVAENPGMIGTLGVERWPEAG